MLFIFNRLTLLAKIFSLQFTEISEYQPSTSYRASKSRFFPYIHCKFCRVCPTTKMTSATVKPSIVCPGNPISGNRTFRFSISRTSKFSEARKVVGKTRKKVTSYEGKGSLLTKDLITWLAKWYWCFL